MRSRLHTCALSATLGVLVLTLGCSKRGVSTPPVAPVTSASVSASIASASASVASTSPVTVTLVPRATLGGDVLSVSVTTDLADASIVDWEVGRWSDGGGDPYRTGKATVKAGRFSFHTSVRSIPGEQLYVFLVFAIGEQPASVRTRYGEFGQNLRGSHVTLQGDYRMLEYWVKIKR
jgi:hypothetical protein